MEKTLNTIIVLRNDKSTDWADSDVILREGEVGVSYLENGNVVVKAGDKVLMSKKHEQMLPAEMEKLIIPKKMLEMANGQDIEIAVVKEGEE